MRKLLRLAGLSCAAFAALGLVHESMAAAQAVPCSTLPNPIYVAGSSAIRPLLFALGAKLAADATTPTTVVETRPAYTPVGLPGAPLTPNTIYPLHLTDTALVPAGATAVVLNVTVVQPTNFGHIRVYPDTNGSGTTPAPVMSNINFIPGRDIPNLVIVQLPADRTIDFYTSYAGIGHTDLKVDLIGYISAHAG